MITSIRSSGSDPDFTSPAKALLYPIKNAQAIVRGEATIDDLCLYAPRTQVLQIIFEEVPGI